MNEWKGTRKHTYEWVFDYFNQGKFDIDGLITHRFPMKDFKEAIRVATSKKESRSIKVEFLHEA
jgi:threonine dehydrogenase-like Zn-dependent dehydrogenase